MKRFFLVMMMAGLISMNNHAALAQEGDAMISAGKTVEFEYTLKVEGEVVDTSEGREPLKYTHGQKMIIPGLENALEGLKVGDEKNVVVTPADGYGDDDPNMYLEVPREQLDPNVEPAVGMILQMQTNTGQQVPGMITEVKDAVVVINFNHPLAGKELAFDVKIVSIN